MTIEQLLKKISDSDLKNPTVMLLMKIIRKQSEEIQLLKDEIARLKGNNPRPQITPSTLEKSVHLESSNKERPARKKREVSKTKSLEILKEQILKADDVPKGNEFKGYEDYFVQELIISPCNIKFRRERWLAPEGKTIIAKLPKDIVGFHYGPILRSHIMHQHFGCCVTQNQIVEQLREIGTDISAATVNNILISGHDNFHQEKDDVLTTGLCVSSYINVDDTGARHQGKNAYCTHIGSRFFAWFKTTFSKSRINFLTLLRASFKDYILNEHAMAYAEVQKLPKAMLSAPGYSKGTNFENESDFNAFLKKINIKTKRHQRLAANKTELLLVLQRPDIPLHNNLSENDIREYVKRRLISSSTSSDLWSAMQRYFLKPKVPQTRHLFLGLPC